MGKLKWYQRDDSREHVAKLVDWFAAESIGGVPIGHAKARAMIEQVFDAPLCAACGERPPEGYWLTIPKTYAAHIKFGGKPGSTRVLLFPGCKQCIENPDRTNITAAEDRFAADPEQHFGRG